MNTSETSVEDDLGEKLSAFLDGELSDREMARLAARLETDRAARARYARYAQISAYLGGNGAGRVDASGIGVRVSAALEKEPTVLAPPRGRKALRIPRLALGAALAAGAAVLAVALAPQIVGMDKPTALPQTESFAFTPRMSVPADRLRTVSLQAGPQRVVVHRTAPSSPQSGHWRVLEPAVRDRLNRYLLQHNEVAGRITTQQPSAYVSFVSAPATGR